MINAKEVNRIFEDCLVKTLPTDGQRVVEVGGIVQTVVFDVASLERNSQGVREMLKQLPSEFFSDSGGGWSFLNMCVTKDGVQWGEHPDMEQLMMLGIGLGYVSMPLPREMWAVLPGGMPYIVINAEVKQS